ncbi:HTH-type transcriptional regulator DmlR [compost metagenome]
MNMLQAMEVFVEVVDAGSFAAAAERLRLQRPAVTKAVQQLEHQLGVQLLHRTTRKVTVTTEGVAFYTRCNKLLADVADTLAHFSPDRPPKGPLRVDLPISLAKAIIIPALPDFQARYPDVALTLRSSDHQVDLVGEGIDCAVRVGELADSSLIVRKIGIQPMMTCAAPTYVAAHGLPSSVDDLDDHVAVNFLFDHTRRTMDWVFQVEGRLVSKTVRSGIVVDDSEALVGCAIAGMGLVQAPQASLLPHVQAGALVEVLGHVPPPAKAVSLISTDRRFTNPAVQAFAGWVQALLGAHPLNQLFPSRK